MSIIASYPHLFSLQDKIKETESCIIEAYNINNGKLFISFSGGKDSTILRHIALRLFPDIKVVFSNTTNELKEVLDYVKTFPNVITVFPKMNFKQVSQKHGFPLVSKEVSQKVNELKRTHGRKTRNTRFNGDKKGNGRLSTKWRYLAEQEFDVTHKCCAILKKDPLEKWAKKDRLKPIIALMQDESMLRMQLALYGKDDGKKIYPFLNTGWGEADIWEYARQYNIRFAECYYDRIINGALVKARKRTGCEYCGFGITHEEEDRFARSKITNPKRYESIMKIENNGITFLDAIGIVKAKNKTPILDLYGVKLSNVSKHKMDDDAECSTYSVDSTTLIKECPHCKSKNIQRGFGHYGNYIDSPHPKTKKRRWVFVQSEYGYDCLDCKLPIIDDLHMFNTEHVVTDRLVKYIHANINKKSFAEITDETGISFEKAYKIAMSYKKEKIA